MQKKVSGFFWKHLVLFMQMFNTAAAIKSNLHCHFKLVIHSGASKTSEIKCNSQEMQSADTSANTSPVRKWATLHIPELRLSADQRSTCVTQARAAQAPLSVQVTPCQQLPQLIPGLPGTLSELRCHALSTTSPHRELRPCTQWNILLLWSSTARSFHRNQIEPLCHQFLSDIFCYSLAQRTTVVTG